MHARVCACVWCVWIPPHRHEGVAWRNAMLERAQQHDESWNGSLVPPRTLFPSPGYDLPPFHRLLSLSLQPPRFLLSFSLFARSFAAPLALSLFFPLRVFLALAYYSLVQLPSLYLSIYLCRSFSFLLFLGQHMDAILARARTQGTVRRCRRVDERSLCRRPRLRSNAPAVSSFSPRRNTTKVPPFVHSSVRLFVRSFVPPLQRLFGVVLLRLSYPLVLSSFFPPVSSGKPRRESPSKTDRRRLADESLSRRVRSRQNCIIAFSVSCLVRHVSEASVHLATSPLPAPPQIVPLSR